MSFCLMVVNPLRQWMVRETLDIGDENAVNLVLITQYIICGIFR